MKNYKVFFRYKLFAFVILFSSIQSVFAIHSLVIKSVQNTKTFSLYFKTEKANEEIDIKILDEEDVPVYAQKINPGNTFLKSYNLKKLEHKSYFLSIEDPVSITVQPLKIEGNQIHVDKNLRKITYKPIFNFNAKKRSLDINWMHGTKKPVNLTIEGNNLDFHYEDSIKNTPDIHKRYNISLLPNGDYLVYLSSGIRTYSKRIRIE